MGIEKRNHSNEKVNKVLEVQHEVLLNTNKENLDKLNFDTKASVIIDAFAPSMKGEIVSKLREIGLEKVMDMNLEEFRDLKPDEKILLIDTVMEYVPADFNPVLEIPGFDNKPFRSHVNDYKDNLENSKLGLLSPKGITNKVAVATKENGLFIAAKLQIDNYKKALLSEANKYKKQIQKREEAKKPKEVAKEKRKKVEKAKKKKLEKLNISVTENVDIEKLKTDGYTEMIRAKIGMPSSFAEWEKNPRDNLKKLSKYLVEGCELKTEIDLVLSVENKKDKWYKENLGEILNTAFEEFNSYSSSSDFDVIFLADRGVAKMLKGGILDNQAQSIRRLSALNIDNLFELSASKISKLSKESKIKVMEAILAEQSSDFEFSGKLETYINLLDSNEKLPKEVLNKIDAFIFEKINELRAVKSVTENSKSLLRTLSNRTFGENLLDTKNELDLDPESGAASAKNVMNKIKEGVGWSAEAFKNAPGPVKALMVFGGIWGIRYLMAGVNMFEGDSKSEEDLSVFSKILRMVGKAALGVGIIWGGSELYKKYAKRDAESTNLYFSEKEAITFFGLKDNKDSREQVRASIDGVFYDDVIGEKPLSEVEDAYNKSSSSKDSIWRDMIRNTEHLDKSNKYSPENAREGLGLMIKRYSPEHKDDDLSIYKKAGVSEGTKKNIARIWNQSRIKGDEWRDAMVMCMAYDKEFAKENSVEAYHKFSESAERYAEYETKVYELEFAHGVDKISIKNGILFFGGNPIEDPVKKEEKKYTADEYDRYLTVESLKQYTNNFSVSPYNVPYIKKLSKAVPFLKKGLKVIAGYTTDTVTNNDSVVSLEQFKKYDGSKHELIPKKVAIMTNAVSVDKDSKIRMAGATTKVVYESKAKFLADFKITHGVDGHEMGGGDVTFTKHASGSPVMVDFPYNVNLVAKKKVNLEKAIFYGQYIEFNAE